MPDQESGTEEQRDPLLPGCTLRELTSGSVPPKEALGQPPEEPPDTVNWLNTVNRFELWHCVTATGRKFLRGKVLGWWFKMIILLNSIGGINISDQQVIYIRKVYKCTNLSEEFMLENLIQSWAILWIVLEYFFH